MPGKDEISYDSTTSTWHCKGDWDIPNLPRLEAMLAETSWPSSGQIIFDGEQITKMDSAGAWLLISTEQALRKSGLEVVLQHFASQTQSLLEFVQKRLEPDSKPPKKPQPSTLAQLGEFTLVQINELQEYLAFIGQLTFEALRIGINPKHWRWGAVTSIVYRTGYQALPIIALLSFLIGVVLTYQMGLQLRNYGASIYIVDLLGLSVTREFAPLITAIMVSGRTGSAFTAQIGMMKLNQEIDALDTLGVTPAELLLLPRIIGLLISLPLLTMWSDIFGIFGGMVMSNNMLGISWYDFLHRFPHVIPLRSLIIGLGKAPVFALIIASIGCFEGMKVKNSADSVGQNTTRSVVLSIFFIIVADAFFSILFSKMKL